MTTVLCSGLVWFFKLFSNNMRPSALEKGKEKQREAVLKAVKQSAQAGVLGELNRQGLRAGSGVVYTRLVRQGCGGF
jgi:hypothetical protein